MNNCRRDCGTIRIPELGVVIELGSPDTNKPGRYCGGVIDVDDTWAPSRCPGCDTADCCFQCDASKSGELEDEADVASRIATNAALASLASVLLAHACAGVDVTDDGYLEGIQTAMSAVAGHLED